MKDIERMEYKISNTLRIGVLIAGAIIFIGWAMHFNSKNEVFALYQTYEQVDLFTSLKAQIILQNWGRLICYFGLFLLILLPIIRVILSVFIFIKQKETKMALIGAIVFVGLLISFFQGL